MSNVQTFIEQLKSDKLIEAFQTIKDDLSARARVVSEGINIQVAEAFNMKAIVEAKDDDNKDDDENMSDEEKEAAKAKKAEDDAKDK